MRARRGPDLPLAQGRVRAYRKGRLAIAWLQDDRITGWWLMDADNQQNEKEQRDRVGDTERER